MPLTATTPREAFHTFQDYFNSVLNKVLTRYRLRFVVSGPKQDQASLAFLIPGEFPLLFLFLPPPGTCISVRN